MAYVFEWDAKKAESNAGKHGVTFDEATTVFGDALAMLMLDPDHAQAETRYLLLGISNRTRLLVVSFAKRSARTRLISARRANRRERKRYEEEG